MNRKKTGITKVCIAEGCREQIISEGNFLGLGYFNVKCPKCGARNRIDIGQKFFITLSKVTIIFLLVLFGLSLYINLSNSETAFIPYSHGK